MVGVCLVGVGRLSRGNGEAIWMVLGSLSGGYWEVVWMVLGWLSGGC